MARRIYVEKPLSIERQIDRVAAQINAAIGEINDHRKTLLAVYPNEPEVERTSFRRGAEHTRQDVLTTEKMLENAQYRLAQNRVTLAQLRAQRPDYSEFPAEWKIYADAEIIAAWEK